MSAKLPIGYINVRVFAHATEDLTKVEVATKNLFPLSLCENLVFQKTPLHGHHSNPIVILEAQFTERKLLLEALQKLGEGLSTLDKEQLSQDIEQRLERGNLYLRFDKQAAYLGNIKFAQNDPIHVKIHFKDMSSQEILDLAKKAGLLP